MRRYCAAGLIFILTIFLWAGCSSPAGSSPEQMAQDDEYAENEEPGINWDPSVGLWDRYHKEYINGGERLSDQDDDVTGFAAGLDGEGRLVMVYNRGTFNDLKGLVWDGLEDYEAVETPGGHYRSDLEMVRDGDGNLWLADRYYQPVDYKKLMVSRLGAGGFSQRYDIVCPGLSDMEVDAVSPPSLVVDGGGRPHLFYAQIRFGMCDPENRVFRSDWNGSSWSASSQDDGMELGYRQGESPVYAPFYSDTFDAVYVGEQPVISYSLLAGDGEKGVVLPFDTGEDTGALVNRAGSLSLGGNGGSLVIDRDKRGRIWALVNDGNRLRLYRREGASLVNMAELNDLYIDFDYVPPGNRHMDLKLVGNIPVVLYVGEDGDPDNAFGYRLRLRAWKGGEWISVGDLDADLNTTEGASDPRLLAEPGDDRLESLSIVYRLHRMAETGDDLYSLHAMKYYPGASQEQNPPPPSSQD